MGGKKIGVKSTLAQAQAHLKPLKNSINRVFAIQFEGDWNKTKGWRFETLNFSSLEDLKNWYSEALKVLKIKILKATKSVTLMMIWRLKTYETNTSLKFLKSYWRLRNWNSEKIWKKNFLQCSRESIKKLCIRDYIYSLYTKINTNIKLLQ